MSCKNQFDYGVILAAGKGSRFKSSLPKVLHKICGRSMLEHTLRAVAPAIRSEIVVVAGFGYDSVLNEVEKISPSFPDLKISIVLQKEQKGTGHATKCALEKIAKNNASVLITPGDCPLLELPVIEDFASSIADNNFSVLSFEPENPFGFGRIIRVEKNYLERIVEEKDANETEKKIKEVNSGIIASKAEILREYLPKLTTSNSQSEYYITDIPELMLKDGLKVSVHKTKDPSLVAGANTRYQLACLEKTKRDKLIKGLMNEGVSFECLTSTFIDDGVEIGNDVFIGANTRLQGNTKISPGAVIEGDSLIKDSTIGENCHIKLGSYVDNSILEANVQIGPFCHIRPGSKLGSDVKIGNFVETKKASLAKGVKANHLSYLGDIEIGENTNIGAGTIICNYDGVNKHKTFIGSNSFVGSNSTIVSPVNIDDNAYIGAGSVITKEVPAGSLAIARGRQKNIEGWTERKNRK